MRVTQSSKTGKFVSKVAAKADPGGTFTQTTIDKERIALAVQQAVAEAQDGIETKMGVILDGVAYRVVQLLKKKK